MEHCDRFTPLGAAKHQDPAPLIGNFTALVASKVKSRKARKQFSKGGAVRRFQKECSKNCGILLPRCENGRRHCATRLHQRCFESEAPNGKQIAHEVMKGVRTRWGSSGGLNEKELQIGFAPKSNRIEGVENVIIRPWAVGGFSSPKIKRQPAVAGAETTLLLVSQ